VVLPPRESATVTTKDIITNLRTLIASANTVESTRTTWQNAVKADKDERAKLKAFVSSVEQALLLAFAGSIETLSRTLTYIARRESDRPLPRRHRSRVAAPAA
jgi:hypothetical protein